MTRALTAVLLPGTGSDEVFVRSVFSAAVTTIDLRLHAPSPRYGPELILGYLAELDSAAAHGPIVVGGISLGAHVAAAWAMRNQARCAGLLLAMPAWIGEPGDAPAAQLATTSARLVADHGTAAALGIARRGTPIWLSAELSRAWHRYGDGLAAALAVAAREPAPRAAELHGLPIPAGVACCTDDPVHPAEIAEEWAAALPIAALTRTTLAAVGSRPAALGDATVAAYRRACAAAAGEPAPPAAD